MTFRDPWIDEVIAASPIREVAVALGLRISERTATLALTRCPFHDDHRPSLNLYTKSRDGERFHCFACNAHGGVVDLVKQCRGASFREAIDWLAERKNMPRPRRRPREADRASTGKALGLRLARERFAVMSDEERKTLETWAADRELALDLLERAEISAALSSKILAANDGPETLDALEAAGLIHRESGSSNLSGSGFLPLAIERGFFAGSTRVLFPIRGSEGQLIGYAARATVESKAPKYLFTRGFDRSAALYRLDAVYASLRASRGGAASPFHIYIVEGLVDALRLESVGLHAIAILGTGLADGQLGQLKLLAATARDLECVLAIHLYLDSDVAGDVAAKRIALALLVAATTSDAATFHVDVVRVPLSLGKDPDEHLVRLHQTAPEVDAAAFLRAWTVSPIEFFARTFLGLPIEGAPTSGLATSLATEWLKTATVRRLACMRQIDSLLGESNWRAVLARTDAFSTWEQASAQTTDTSDARADDVWRRDIQRFLNVAHDAPAVTSARAAATSIAWSEELMRATHIARASMLRGEVPQDVARWDRILQVPDLFFAELTAHLAGLGGELALASDSRLDQLEPYVAALVPKGAGREPRKKAIGCPEDLIVQQVLLNSLLRSHANVPEFDAHVPAIRFARGKITRTGGRSRAHHDLVSFAYQIDQDVVDAADAPRGHGMFLPFYQCWASYLRFADETIASMSAPTVVVERHDIKNFYGSIQRHVVVGATVERLTAAFRSMPDADRAKTIPDPLRARWPDHAPAALASKWVEALCDLSFCRRYYDPNDGAERTFGEDDGLPQGPDLSAYLANIVLFKLDDRMLDAVDDIRKRTGVNALYARYVDDILLAATTEDDARTLRRHLEHGLRELGLELKADKNERSGPRSVADARAWLTEGRSSAARRSGPLTEPAASISLFDPAASIELGRPSRSAVLAMLADEMLEDYTLDIATREDALVLAVGAHELRHGDWIRIAQVVWRWTLDDAEPTSSSAEIAVLFKAAWQRIVGSVYPGGDDSGAACEALLCVEAIQRILSRRSDLDPSLSEERRLRRQAARARLAKLVGAGLLAALMGSLGSGSGITFALKLHVLAAAQSANAALSSGQAIAFDAQLIPRDEHRAIAMMRLDLVKPEAEPSRAEQLSTLRLGSAHILVSRLLGMRRDDPTALHSGVVTLDEQFRAFDPKALAYATQVAAVLAKQASTYNADLYPLAVRVLMTSVGPGHGLKYVAEQRWLLAGLDVAGDALPLLPAIEAQPLFVADVDKVVALHERQLPISFPELDGQSWVEISGPSNGDQWFSRRQLANRAWSPASASGALGSGQARFGALAKWMTLLIEYGASSAADGEVTTLVVPTPANIVVREGRPIGILGARVFESQVASQAFTMLDGGGLQSVAIPSAFANVWRAGVVLTTLLFDAREARADLDSLRLSCGESSSIQAPGDDLLRYALALLRGPKGTARASIRRTTATSAEMPWFVERLLRRLSAVGEELETLEAEGLAPTLDAALLSTIAHGAAWTHIREREVDLTPPGAVSHSLLCIAVAVVRKTHRAVERLPLDANAQGELSGDPTWSRPARAWRSIGARIVGLRSRSTDALDLDALSVLASGATILSVHAQLRMLVLTLLRLNPKLPLPREIDERLAADWKVGDDALLVDADGVDGIVAAIPEPPSRTGDEKEFTAAVGEGPGTTQSRRLHSILRSAIDAPARQPAALAAVTPLGWCAALSALTAQSDARRRPLAVPLQPEASRGPAPGDGDSSLNERSQKLEALAAAVKEVGVWLAAPRGDNATIVPGAARDADDDAGAWSIISTWAASTHVNGDLSLRRIESLVSGITTLVSGLWMLSRHEFVGSRWRCSVRPREGEITFTTRHNGDRVVPRYAVTCARLVGSESVPEHIVTAGECNYSWEETWCGSKLLTVGYVEPSVSRAAGWCRATVAERAAPRSTDRSAEIVIATDASDTGAETPVNDPTARGGVSRGRGGEPAAAPTKAPLELPSVELEVAEVHAEEPRPTARSSAPRDRRTFDDFRTIANRRRANRHPGHIRIAMFQFDVDDSFQHPVREKCKNATPPASVEHVASCAESRRRRLLLQAIDDCAAFGVQALVLPELSVRPETVEWLVATLEDRALDLCVWAGSFRRPLGYDMQRLAAPLKSRDFAPWNRNVPFDEWETIVPLVAPTQVARLVTGRPVAATSRERRDLASLDANNARAPKFETLWRQKRYRAVALGEWFTVDLAEPIRPLLDFQSLPGPTLKPVPPDTSTSVTETELRHHIFELICSEVFLISSAANVFEIALDLVSQARSRGDASDSEEWVRRDFIALGRLMSFAMGDFRKSILFVPAMTTRTDDYELLGRSSLLAAGITTVFVGAVAKKHGKGGSCVYGQSSFDKDSDELLGIAFRPPYMGVEPGIARGASKTKAGRLGEEEQALVIVDIDPIHQLEGKPRPQTLQPPLRLIAHIPYLEVGSPVAPNPSAPAAASNPPSNDRVGRREDKQGCRCVTSSAANGRMRQRMDKLQRDFSRLLKQRGEEKPAVPFAKMLGRLARAFERSLWMTERATQFATHWHEQPWDQAENMAVDWRVIDLDLEIPGMGRTEIIWAGMPGKHRP